MASDESLYKDICNGSNEAFAELYARYEGPLFGFILRRIGNRQDAEEVFHDVMMAIVKDSSAEFKEGGFAAWIYKIALNRSFNKLRSRHRANNALDRMAISEETAVSMFDHRIDQQLIDKENLDQVAKAAKNLSSPLRAVYDLRQAGKSYEETADILGLPVGSVKSRVNSVVKQLRKEISKWIVK